VIYSAFGALRGIRCSLCLLNALLNGLAGYPRSGSEGLFPDAVITLRAQQIMSRPHLQAVLPRVRERRDMMIKLTEHISDGALSPGQSDMA
jgi:hypothetical protein